MSQLKRYDPFAIEPVGDIFQGLLRSVRGSMDSALPFKVASTSVPQETWGISSSGRFASWTLVQEAK